MWILVKQSYLLVSVLCLLQLHQCLHLFLIPDPVTITYSQLHEITTAPVLTPMTTQQALAFWIALPGHFEDTTLHPVGHYDEELLNQHLSSAGVHIVHGQEDPCSNFWRGPVWYLKYRWPTWEHAIVARMLEVTTTMSMEEIISRLEEFAGNSPSRAKQYGK